jgi:glycosyltransferase involved in cell wall biosynthesis
MSTAAAKIKIVHVINSFEFGGAEAMLCNLLLRTDRDRFEPSVVALIDDLSVAGPVIDAGIPIAVMGMRRGIPSPLGVARLARHLRRVRPAIVQTWMDHSNLIGGIASRLATRAPVVWGVHHSDHVRALTKRTTLITVGACARLSHYLPARIVFCSEHARTLYGQRGFAAAKMEVIPNGFDISRFRPDPTARAEIRRELKLEDSTPLIGLVARYDPFKDHAGFLRAAALLIKTRPDAHFLLCGSNVNCQNAALASLVNSLGLAGRCHLLGPRRDVPRLMAALDILASSSISEAFPLTVGEAMACGVPCVATDVGDSVMMVGATGCIVPPRDPQAMAHAWNQLFALAPEARVNIGGSARRRVCDLFDLQAVTRRYESLYRGLVASEDRPHFEASSRNYLQESKVAQVA